MRNPLRSEAEAFSFVLVMVVLFGAVAVAGVLGGGWVALGVFLALALGVWLGMYMKGEPRAADPSVWETMRRPHERHRILVVANETLVGRALRDEIARRARGKDAEVLVVCPALNSPLKHWVSDEDGARELAQRRLDESLASLREEGVEAGGAIGDADPLTAIEDALRTFGADEIVLSTHPPGRSNWLERGVVARARAEFPLPLTHVVVDLAGERARV